MRRTNLIAGIIFLVISLYTGVTSYGLEMGSLASPEAGFIPLVVSVLLFGCSCIFIVLAFRGRLKPPETEGSRPPIMLLIGFLLFTGIYLLLLYFLGIWIATFPALMVLYWKSGGKSLARSAVFAGLAIVCAYLLFSVALRVDFPKGMLLDGGLWTYFQTS
jgi:putative tricarboxylic transport membrane protein